MTRTQRFAQFYRLSGIPEVSDGLALLDHEASPVEGGR